MSSVNLDATQLARCTEMHGPQRYTSVADGALALEIIDVTATKAGELSAAPVDASGRQEQVCTSMLRHTSFPTAGASAARSTGSGRRA